MKKETIASLAQRTGYSMSTISRVLNGCAEKYRISKKTADAILKEAQKCNYTPSLLAKGLRTNKTSTIGLIIPSIDNPYFATFASVIINQAKSANYQVILVDSMENEATEVEALSSLISRRVDGIIAVPCGSNSKRMESINEQEVPIVLIDRYYKETNLPYICSNNYEGGLMATNHLIESGHKKILCIQGIPHALPVKERVRGYKDAMRGAGFEERIQIAGEDFTIGNGYLETKLAINSNDCPTAIFAMSNTILLGVLKALREGNLSVPKDISVVSFDNYTYLDYLSPAITCISQPINEISSLALKILLQRINTSEIITTSIQLPPKLVVRDSVRKI